MLHNPWFAGGLVAIIAVCGLALLAAQFSPEARLRRRRRKSHGRLVAKARRPMVRFSVKVPKP
jgi:hypothetical protein